MSSRCGHRRRGRHRRLPRRNRGGSSGNTFGWIAGGCRSPDCKNTFSFSSRPGTGCWRTCVTRCRNRRSPRRARELRARQRGEKKKAAFHAAQTGAHHAGSHAESQRLRQRFCRAMDARAFPATISDVRVSGRVAFQSMFLVRANYGKSEKATWRVLLHRFLQQ